MLCKCISVAFAVMRWLAGRDVNDARHYEAEARGSEAEA